MAVKNKTISDLGELQRTVMEIIWEQKQATVKDVLEVVSSRRKSPPAYTTILTVMQKLEKAGFIRHIKQRNSSSDDIAVVDAGNQSAKKRAYKYEPVRTREYEQSRALRDFIETVWTEKELLESDGQSGDSLESFSRLTATRAKVLLFKYLLDDELLSKEQLMEIKVKLDRKLEGKK